MKESIIITRLSELETLLENSIRKVLSEQNFYPQKAEDEYFNIKQAATFLNLAIQTLYGFTSKNTIPFSKRGKKLYFKKSDLENWIAAGNQKTNLELSEELSAASRNM